MRSSKRSKTQKKPHRRYKRVHKKNINKSIIGLDWNTNLSNYLIHLNEVLRENKAARAEGKGSWKVVPKDSCEVYKKRLEKSRQKQENTEKSRQKNENNEDDLNDYASQMDEDKRDEGRKKPRKRSPKKKVPARKFNPRKNKKRPRESSMSTYTVTSASYTSLSEMEYE